MADRKLTLRIVSPHAATVRRPFKLQKFSDLVIMRCVSGDLGVMVGRMPCTVMLGTGVLRSFKDGKEYLIAVHGGIAQVKNDVVTVLTELALLPREIDTDDVNQKIRELEQKLLGEESSDEKKRIKAELHGFRIQLAVAAAQ